MSRALPNEHEEYGNPDTELLAGRSVPRREPGPVAAWLCSSILWPQVRFTPGQGPRWGLPPLEAWEGKAYTLATTPSRLSFLGPAGDVRAPPWQLAQTLFTALKANPHSFLPSGPFSENMKLLARS